MTAQVPHNLRCPCCNGDRIQGHGSFPLKDGTRQPRYRCLSCRKTFNPLTGTPLAHLKKRELWPAMATCMAQGLSVRKTAAALGVQVATAFAWRHRLLFALRRQPLPVLAGTVATWELLVRYSEKGSRTPGGPGARRGPRPLGREPFRRFIDGKPICVLVAGSAEQVATLAVSQGWPTADDLRQCLPKILQSGVTLFSNAYRAALYAEACGKLGIAQQEISDWQPPEELEQLVRRVIQARGSLCSWLRGFHGVATKYLSNYLAWHRFAWEVRFGREAAQDREDALDREAAVQSAEREPDAAGRLLLAQAGVQRRWGDAAPAGAGLAGAGLAGAAPAGAAPAGAGLGGPSARPVRPLCPYARVPPHATLKRDVTSERWYYVADCT